MDINKLVSTAKSVIVIALCVFILYSFYTIPSPIQHYVQRFINYIIVGAIIGVVIGVAIVVYNHMRKTKSLNIFNSTYK